MNSFQIFVFLVAVYGTLGCGKPGTTSGGFCPVDIDGTVETMAKFAVHAYESKYNAVLSGPIVITKASSQLVSGHNYKMTIEATFDGKDMVCQFIVYSQPWTNTVRLTYDVCNPKSYQLITTAKSHLLQTLLRK